MRRLRSLLITAIIDPLALHGPWLICPLDRDSNTQHAYTLGKRRMIDVRAGDTVQHAKGRWKVLGVKAWRECYFPKGEAAPCDGYLVRTPPHRAFI